MRNVFRRIIYFKWAGGFVISLTIVKILKLPALELLVGEENWVALRDRGPSRRKKEVPIVRTLFFFSLLRLRGR